MRWGFAVSAIGQTGQSEAIHSPEAWASVVVKLTIPALLSMAVVCKVAISCCPSVLRTMSSPAQHSGVSEPTVARLESVDGELGGREGTVEKIRTAIQIAGIEFIDENGGGRGVRLRKRTRPRGQRSA